MEKDVEAKLDRLCLKYLQAQAELETIRPVELPTGRASRKLRSDAARTVMALRSDRLPAAAALVRLAYVRGMRGVNPEARLGEIEQREVEFLQRRLDQELEKVEAEAYHALRGHLRKLKVAQTLEAHDYPSLTIASLTNTARFPLEERARVSIRTIVDTALKAGASTATNTTGYDGGENADG